MDDVLVIALRLALAAVFSISAYAKLVDLRGTREALAAFGVPAKLVPAGAIALPLVEGITAALMLPASTAVIGGILATLLLLVFTAAIAYNLKQGREPECNCFGAIARQPIGLKTLIRNAILLVMALAVTALSANGATPSAVTWLEDLSAAQTTELMLLAIIAVATATIAYKSALIVPLLGHLQASLGNIESNLSKTVSTAENGGAIANGQGDIGLPIGTVAPAFTLDGVYGETGTLESLRSGGTTVLLVFSSPNCNPCNALMPDIGKWQREQSHVLTVAVIGRGEAAANRAKSAEHGLRNVLLQQSDEVSREYNANLTPVGVLIDPDGVIATPFAAGSDAIRDLANEFIAGRQETLQPIPFPEPATIAVGSTEEAQVANASSEPQGDAPADGPTVDIGVDEEPHTPTDLFGNPVELISFLSDETLLLFWSPGCGHCTRMLDDLKAWEADRQEGSPDLVVISRGTIEENEAQAIASPVLLDQYFAIGHQYGAGGTPTAIMVDRAGEIVGTPTVGGPFIIALLKGEEPPEMPPPPPPPVVLKAGDPAPEFALSTLDGEQLALSDLAGVETFVLFWSPGCIHCQRMVDDLRAWESNKPTDAPSLVVISRGDLEANRAAGLESPVLMDEEYLTGVAYGATGTPSGYLIDGSGHLASDLLVGAGAAFRTLNYVSEACQECLDACAQQGGGEACRMVCQMSGQCY